MNLTEHIIIDILSYLSEDDLRNTVRSSEIFFQIISGSSKLKKKFTLCLDVLDNQERSNPEFYQSMNIAFTNVSILNWGLGIRNDVILRRLTELINSIENVIFKFGKFEDSYELFNIIQRLSKLKTLKFESCTLMRHDSSNQNNFQFTSLTSIAFDDCNENLYRIFKNQVSIQELEVISIYKIWIGFPHEELNALAVSLPSLRHLKLIGEGSVSYFESNEFPYRIESLKIHSFTSSWYVEIDEPRIQFLTSQRQNLKVLEIQELPYDFDGGKILRFIFNDMNLETFIYDKILLISNGKKQDVKRFSATDTQIEASLEMFRQFPGIEFFTIKLNDEDPAVDEIEKSISTSGMVFSSLKEFELINQNNYDKWPNFYKEILKKFQNVNITSFRIRSSSIEIFVKHCTEITIDCQKSSALKEIEDNYESDFSSGDENFTFDILSNLQITIKKEFVLDYPKIFYKSIKNESRRNYRYLKFTQDWKFEEIFATVAAFQPSNFPNLLGIIFDVNEIVNPESTRRFKRRKIDEISKYTIKNFLKHLVNFSKNRPFILQLTSKKRNLTKIYYKDDDSNQFHIFDNHQNQPCKIESFQNFLLSCLNKKIENFEDTMTKALPAVKNLSLIWEFSKTLELTEDFITKIILKCAANGTKDQLLTILGGTHENEKMNQSVISSIIRVFNFDSSIEQSILLNAVDNSNAEIIKYLIDECSHLIQHLPFGHQVAISTAAYKRENIDLLCDLVQFCDFPFPKEFNAASLNNKRLEIIINDRRQFHEAIKSNHVENINRLIKKFFVHKMIFNAENQSALYQALMNKNYEIYHYLKLTFGLELSNERKECTEKFKNLYAQWVTVKGTFDSGSIPDEENVAALIERSSIHLTTGKNKYRQYKERISKWFQQINKMKFGSTLLKVVSSCNNLKIAFDFDNEYQNKINYTESDEDTIGIASTGDKWIFISAKYSDDIEKERKIRGSIAHECCHYAIKLVYKNFYKPYYNSKKNKEVQQLYQNIIKDVYRWLCAQPLDVEGFPIDECENMILNAFYYDKMLADSIPVTIEQELIVRAVEILAYYYDDDDKIRKLEVILAPLFNFYAFHVNTEFENFNFEKRKIVSEFNKKSGILRELKKSMYIGNKRYIELTSHKDMSIIKSNKITFVTTNIPKLLLYDIYVNAPKGPNLFDTENIIISAQQLLNLNKIKGNEDFTYLLDNLNDISNLNFFIDCTMTSEINLYWNNRNKKANYIYIFNNQEECDRNIRNQKKIDHKKFEINYNWNDLTEETIIALLQTKINFRNNSTYTIVDLLNEEKDLNDPSAIIFEELTTEFLLDDFFYLFNDHDKIQICKEFEDQEFDLIYQKRKFLQKKGKEYEKMLNNHEILTLENLLERTLNEKYVLLVDKAGSGKSWSLKSIAKKIREKFPKIWVTYVDFNEYPDIFNLKKEGINNQGIKNKLNFTDFIIHYILNIKKSLDEKIFNLMYKNGRVIILFDGIVPDCAEFVYRLAHSFEHNKSNQLWISTRSTYEISLQKKLNIKVSFKLVELNMEEEIQLVTEILALNDLKNKGLKSLAKDQFSSKIKEFNDYNCYRNRAKYLISRISKFKWNWKEISQVQLYKMLAYIGDSIDELSEFDIYEKYINMHIEKWTVRENILRENIKIKVKRKETNFIMFHVYHAVKGFFPEFIHLCSKNNSRNVITHIDAIKYGLMEIKNGKAVFIHQTIAEFFVALFVINIIEDIFAEKKDIDEDAIKFIAQIIENRAHYVVHMFIDGALEKNKTFKRIDQIVKTKHSAVLNFKKIFFHLDVVHLICGKYINFNRFKNIEKLIHFALIQPNFKEVMEVLSKSLRNRIKEAKSEDALNEISLLYNNVFDFFRNDDMLKFLITEHKKQNINSLTEMILEKHVRHHQLDFLAINGIIDELMDADFKQEISKQTIILIWKKIEMDLLTKKNREKFRQFAHSLQLSLKIFAKYCNKINSNQTMQELLMEISRTNSINGHEFTFVSINDIFGIDQPLDIERNYYIILQKCAEYNIFDENSLQKFFSELFNEYYNHLQFDLEKEKRKQILSNLKKNEENFLSNATFDHSHNSVLKLLEKLRIIIQAEKLKKRSQDLNSILKDDNNLEICNENGKQLNAEYEDSSCIENKNQWIFEQSTEHFKEHLNQGKLFRNSTDFISLAECSELEIYDISWKFLLQKYKNREELKNILLHEKIHGENFIFHLVSHGMLEILKFTLNVFYKFFNKTQVKEILSGENSCEKNLLQKNMCTEVFELLWNFFNEYFEESDMERFIKHSDINGNCLFHYAVDSTENKVFKLIWTKLKKLSRTSSNLVAEVISKQNKSGQNIIHLVIQFKDMEKFEFLWTVIENFFKINDSSQLFRKFVMDGVMHQGTILHYVVEKCFTIEFHETLWKLLLQTFEHHHNELWNFMSQTDKSNQTTFIHTLVKHSKLDIIKFTLKIIRINFGSEILVNLIGKCDENERNVFHYAIYWISCENFECLVDELIGSLSFKDIKKMLSNLDNENRNLLQTALIRIKLMTFHESLWACLKKFFDASELMNFIKHCDIHGKNLLKLAFEFNTADIAKFTFKSIKNICSNYELLKILEIDIENSENLLHYTVSRESLVKIQFLFEELEQLVSCKHMIGMLQNLNKQDQNLLQSAVCCSKYLIFHEFLWNYFRQYFNASEILSFIGHCDKYGNNLLHSAVKFNTKKVVEFIWNEVQHIVKEADENLADMNFEKINEIDQYIKYILQNEDKLDERKLCAKSLDLNWFKDKNLWIFKLSAEQFEVHLNQGKLFKIPIDFDNLAVSTDIEIHKISWKFLLKKFEKGDQLKKFVLYVNKRGNNYVHQLMYNEDFEIIKATLLNFAPKIFNKIQIKEILNSKDSQLRNLLQKAAFSFKSAKDYKFLWDILCSYFDESEIVDFINHTDSYGNCLIMYAARWSVKDVFEIIWTELNILNFFFKSSIAEIIKKQNIFGQNILHICIESKESSKVLFLWKEIESYYVLRKPSETFIKFVAAKDFCNNTILHIAIQNCDVIDLHRTLWNLLLKSFNNHQEILWKIIQEVNDDNKSLMHYLVEESNRDIILFTFEIIKNNFGLENFLDFFGTRGKDGKYLIHYSACSSTHKNFELIIDELANLPSKKDYIRFLKTFETD